jgi:hypothetical protein
MAIRWLVIGVLTLATAGMFLVSMRANYLYGYGIGQTPETQIAIAWANVGADVWKGFGLIVVVALWRRAHRRAALAVSATWLVCLAFSVSSAIGIYVQERTALTSGREARHASYEDAAKELALVEVRLKALTAHRPAAQLEAMIAGILARPVTVGERIRGTVDSLSSSCAKNDTRTASDCVEIAGLRAELGVAREATRLEARAADLRQQVVALRERGGSAAPDPVGEFWAWITRGWISVKDVGFGLPLAFALMIEMVSAFGPLGIASYAEATRSTTERAMSRHVVLEPGVARSVPPQPAERLGGDGRVVHYMAERTEPTTNASAIGADDLHADYEVWCVGQGLRSLAMTDFIDEFDRVRGSPQLAGKIKKFGTRYFGIAFVDGATTNLPVRQSG